MRSNLDVFSPSAVSSQYGELGPRLSFRVSVAFSKQLLRVVAGMFAPTLTRVADSVVSFPGVQVPVKSNDVLGVTKIRDIVNLDIHYEES